MDIKELLEQIIQTADIIDQQGMHKQAETLDTIMHKIAAQNVLENIEQGAERQVGYQVQNQVNKTISNQFNKKKKSVQERAKEALSMDVLNQTKARYENEDMQSTLQQRLQKENPNMVKQSLLSDMVQFVYQSPKMQGCGWETSGGFTEGFMPWFRSTGFYRELSQTINNAVNSAMPQQDQQQSSTGGRHQQGGYNNNYSNDSQPQQQGAMSSQGYGAHVNPAAAARWGNQ